MVEAENEPHAGERRNAAFEELYAELRKHHPALQFEIRTVRPATLDKIEFCGWNEETLAREAMGRRV